MIDIPVVLVLRAGASSPHRFPIGQGLVEEALCDAGSGLR